MKLSRNLSAALFVTMALLTRLAPGAYAQAGIFLDNINNTGGSGATTNGLFWVKTNNNNPVLIHQDFNAAFYGGTNATNLSLIATFLLSDGTANGDNAAGAGTFLDPTGYERMISGASSWAYFQIQAWFGTYTNYAAAAAAGAYCKQSAVFSNSVVAPPSPPPDLTGMPAIVLTAGGSGSSPSGFTGGDSSGGGPTSGGTPPAGPSGPLGPTGFDPGSTNLCGLWLSVTNTNSVANVSLHGVRSGQNYQVFSIQSLSSNNWTLETNFTAGSSDPALTRIATGGRTNLFFRAQEYRYYVTNTVFPGLTYSNANKNPPDTMAAAGPSQICELLNGAPANTSFAVYNKSGGLIMQTNMTNLFAVVDNGTQYPTGTTMGDPRIMFDSQSQCWVASAIDLTSYQVLLTVCTNANNATNLTSGWTRYVLYVAQPGVDTDSDRLGFDANGLYLSVVHRGGSPSTNAGHTVVAIKKPDIYLGTKTFKYLTSNNDLTLWTLQPAINFDSVPSSGYAWFVAKGPPTLSGNYQGGGIVYRRLQWSGTNAAWADNNWFAISSSTNYQDYYDFDGTNTTITATNGISAPQPNSNTVTLYAVGSRLMDATIRNGFLWSCQTVGLSTNTGTYVGDSSGSNVTRSGMQWLKLQMSPDSSSLTLADHGRIYDTNRTDNPWWYYFPSLMVNCAGDMVAGFSGSTATSFIGAFYTWRLSSGSALTQPGVIQSGLTNSVSTWGDYSATTLDPTDDWSFWTVQEYAAPIQIQTGSIVNTWGTVIARIRPNP